MAKTKVISVANQKGGVGKSTSVYCIGAGLAQGGKKVLLVDVDPQGDLTKMLGQRKPHDLPHTLGDVMNESDAVPSGFYFCDSVGFKQVTFHPEECGISERINGQNAEKISVLFVEPGKYPRMIEIEDSLEAMQDTVKGDIEEFMPYEDEVAIICNEESKMNGMSPNRAIYCEPEGTKDREMADIIFGPFFVCYAPAESEKFLSLPKELAQKYEAQFKFPERFFKHGDEIKAVPYMQLAAAHPKPKDGFAGITILEKPYADKEAAGKAILDVCTKMTGSDAVFLGQYRGFSLVLSYDGPSNEYRMTMKGALSHTAVLGADVFGNLTRMDNVVDGLPGKLDIVRAELTDTQVQLENARTELAAPFAKEAELAEKTARLKELNILLNI